MQQFHKAFSLIELIFVIVIIGILAISAIKHKKDILEPEVNTTEYKTSTWDE